MPPNAMAGCVLPEEIMVSILTRLPVKSILRFKSVCKPWLELLSTREFIKMHQGQFSSDPKNHSLILCGMCVGTVTGTSTTCLTKCLLNVDSNENQQLMTIRDYTDFTVGCCNGLICMCTGRRNILESGRVFFLWNPAMKLFKIVHLSNVDFEFEDPLKVSVGFGYDAEGDDFKVVRIVGLKNESMRINRVEVYSVYSDSWITIEPGFQFRSCSIANTFIMNGNPYWYGEVYGSENNFALVWFDVTKLVFNFVPLQSVPWEKGLGKVKYVDYVDWNGALGAIECYAAIGNERVVTFANVWVFDNVDRIWRKNHTFGPIEGSVLIEGSLFRGLQFLKNGKLLCKKNDKLFVIDTEDGQVKEIVISALQMNDLNFCGYKAFGYSESLSHVKGMVRS